MKKLVMLCVGIAACFTVHAFAAEMSDIMPVLKNAKQAINSTLSEIDTDLKAAAKELSGMDLKGEVARKTLNNLRKFRPYVIDCSIVDADGVKIAVEPAEYKQLEGTDRSDLPYVIRILKTKKPAMSDVYHSSEGIHAIGIGYPIISNRGDIMGAVRMLIRYEVFLKPLVENKPCKIWVMQTNGLIVYDDNPDEIGRDIFTDPFYAPFGDLVSFSKTVALSKNGAGSYNFYAAAPNDKTLVQKIAAWDTAGLYGTEWRVIAMEIAGPSGEPAKEGQ